MGFSQRSPSKRAKSASDEQSTSPWPTAIAARCASGTWFARSPGARRKPARSSACLSVGSGTQTAGQASQSSDRLYGERKIRFQAGEDVAEHLLDHGGFDPSLGARPRRGAVQRLVEAPLAERILAGEFGAGDAIAIGVAADGTGLAFARAARG